MLTDELLTYLFDGKPHLLAQPFDAWLNSSRRFVDFVTANQTKIRKKLRVVHEAESARDLQLELETAYLLVREKSLSLSYEPQHPTLGRGPDFSVSFTTSLEFMVEVTRFRARRSGGNGEGELASGDRFVDSVCSKLGQMLNQRSNLLVVGMEGAAPTLDEIRAAMLRLQRRAEANDPAAIARYGFRDRADFFRHYQRLSALLVRSIPLQAGDALQLWENPQAKYPLPAKVRTALLRSHSL